jgi:hypothetical protein
MFLGIDDNTGLVYEGAGSMPDRLVSPLPTITLAKLIETPEDWAGLPAGARAGQDVWVFREDSFDPVTRTRRGRLFQSMSGAPYPDHSARVFASPRADIPDLGPDGRVPRPLNIFAACASILDKPARGRGLELALGSTRAASAWRIVETELTFSQDVMLALKSLSAFGLLPELAMDQVPERFRDEVRRAIDGILDAAFKESATSVVDRCKDALAMILARRIWQETGDEKPLGWDIGQIAAMAEKEPCELTCAASAARAVGRLHARGKPGEQFAKGARAPSEGDAAFCLEALGLALRDVGWAKPG